MSARPLRFHHLERFDLESGAVLHDVRQAYHLDGELNAARDNLVVVFHALTGSADAREGWWPGVIGPGLAIDTTRYAVLCANLLGSCYGTTGPADCPAGEPFPAITPRDQARLVHALVEHLGARRVALAVGGSLGGMVALEWAASFPELTERAVVFAAPAAHGAQAIGWNQVMRDAVALGGEAGLALARKVGMLLYRTPLELQMRFGRETNERGRYQVESYLAHQGEKFVRRFDAASYLALLGAMDAHDVGCGRGGTAAALSPLGERLLGVGIPGDLLYAPEEVRGWVEAAGGRYRELHSPHGHDAFLLEAAQVGRLLREVLREVEAVEAEIDAVGAATAGINPGRRLAYAPGA